MVSSEKKVYEIIEFLAFAEKQRGYSASFIYTAGNCGNFASLVCDAIPDAVKYCYSEDFLGESFPEHIFVKVENNFFDINGKLEESIADKLLNNPPEEVTFDVATADDMEKCSNQFLCNKNIFECNPEEYDLFEDGDKDVATEKTYMENVSEKLNKFLIARGDFSKPLDYETIQSFL